MFNRGPQTPGCAKHAAMTQERKGNKVLDNERKMKRRGPKNQPRPIGVSVRVTMSFVTLGTTSLKETYDAISRLIKLDYARLGSLVVQYRGAEVEANLITNRNARKYKVEVPPKPDPKLFS